MTGRQSTTTRPPTTTRINECISSPCENGGTCTDQAVGFSCQCHQGFFGNTCQHINPCFFEPCENNGRCDSNVFRPEEYTCVCPAGYGGDRCEQDGSFRNTMYPFGTGAGDLLMPGSVEYSNLCQVHDIPGPGLGFYGRRHDTFSICRNGMIMFDEFYYRYWPRRFGLRFWDNLHYLGVLAPFWAIIERQELFDPSTTFTFDGSLFDEIVRNRNRRSAHSGKTYTIRIDPKRQSKVYYQLYSRWNYTDAAATVLNKSSDDVRKYTKNSLYDNFKASFVVVVTWVNLYPERLQNFPYFELSNTFQAVIITDGVYTFTMFNYPSGGIQWSVPVTTSSLARYWYLTNTLPVAGWNSGTQPRNYFFNAKESSTVAISQLSRLTGNTQETGRWFFQIDVSEQVRIAERKCYNWNLQQPRVLVIIRLPCPCSEFQARWDRRFRRDWRHHRDFPVSSRGSCYLNRRSFRILYYVIDGITNILRPVFGRFSQRCCYTRDSFDFGSILVGPERGGHALLEFSPSIPGFVSDDEAYKACCVDSDLCELFYRKRPSDDCAFYRPPRTRWFWGDPHIITLDNNNYTFNGLGEYVMADIENSFFQLQARTAKAPGGIATVFSAGVAQEESTSKIEARLKSSGGGLDVLVDGSDFDYSSIAINSSQDIGNLSISRDENNGVSATFPSGISVTFSEVKNMMTIVFAAPDSYKNKTRGLLGVWNDDPSDDFTLPDGTTIPESSSDRNIHFNFGLKWQINASQSLFTYAAGEGVDTFKNISYIPLFADELNFTDPALEARAREACGSNLPCLFDIAATSDVSVGQTTLRTFQQLVNESNELENFPPTLVNASSTIVLKLGETKVLDLVANDTNGDPLVFLTPSFPGFQKSVSGNTLTIRLTLSSTSKVNLTVVVRDSKGASAIWSPILQLCECKNGATCSQPANLNGDKFVLMPCKCASGYTGRFCESNLNACDFNGGPCYPGVNCTDFPPPNGVQGFACGSCPAGYSGNGANCTDIVECLNPSTCSQICINTPGSYVCQCQAGYKLNANGRTCDDINECQRPGTCMQRCNNTIGSYNCSCDPAFKVDPADPSKCIPKSPCSPSDVGCQHVCYTENNQKKCSCNKGYELQSDQKTCKDINECTLKPCAHLCENTEGGYQCSCKEGFTLKADNYTCEDINECVQGNYNCSDPFHQCVNIDGGFKCECEQGSYWNGSSCQDNGNKTFIESEAPTPRQASPEEENQAVEIRVQNMPLNKWRATRDKAFKKMVASLIIEYCSKNREKCGLPAQRTASITEDGPLYTEDQVHLLPGYPKQEGNDLIIVFYVHNTPGIVALTNTVPVNTVVDVLQNNKGKVEESLEGRTVTYIRPYKQTAQPPTESINTWVWIVIGVCCALFLLLVIILVIFCRRRKLKRNRKISTIRRYPTPSNYGLTNVDVIYDPHNVNEAEMESGQNGTD